MGAFGKVSDLVLHIETSWCEHTLASKGKLFCTDAGAVSDNGNQGKAHKTKLSAFKKCVKDHCNKLITLWIDSENPMCPFADDAASDIA